ncbi:MAG: type I restriction enzyme HsdR N-terminal domain-containing protein [Deltaproteobacteria bacterium]|nr:type I restriction enzyme HsdR N-terminal domain-containing protein [Deltaproteobacteria bacterium]
MAVDITKVLKKYIPILRKAREERINEAETSLRISKLFEDVLGYDIFNDISKEHVIKDRCVDYAIKINGSVQFLVEVKQAGMNLRAKHVEQASNYAANSGISWVVLTSGGFWQLYHLTFDEGIQSDLVWSVDLLEDNIKDVAPKIAILHKKNVIKGGLEKFYAKIMTLAPQSILQAIFNEDTLKIIGKHLKKMTGIRVDEQDLVEGIKDMISKETWEDIGEVKIKRKRRVSKPKQKEIMTPTEISEPSSTEVSLSMTEPQEDQNDIEYK